MRRATRWRCGHAPASRTPSCRRDASGGPGVRGARLSVYHSRRIPQVGVYAQSTPWPSRHGSVATSTMRTGRPVLLQRAECVRPACEAWQPSVALSEVYYELSARVAVGPQGTASPCGYTVTSPTTACRGPHSPRAVPGTRPSTSPATWRRSSGRSLCPGQRCVDLGDRLHREGRGVRRRGTVAAFAVGSRRGRRGAGVVVLGVAGRRLVEGRCDALVIRRRRDGDWHDGTHAYGQAGTYPISVSASDAVGNSTTATQPIAIASPAPAAPPEECVDPPGLLPCPPAEPAPATPTPATPQTSKPAGCPQSGPLTAAPRPTTRWTARHAAMFCSAAAATTSSSGRARATASTAAVAATSCREARLTTRCSVGQATTASTAAPETTALQVRPAAIA